MAKPIQKSRRLIRPRGDKKSAFQSMSGRVFQARAVSTGRTRQDTLSNQGKCYMPVSKDRGRPPQSAQP
jgi:hypothetical protein